MAFTVPETLRFVCLKCREVFFIRARSLGGRQRIHCPLCGEAMDWIEGLDFAVRRELLAHAKELVSQLVSRVEADTSIDGECLTADVLQLILREIVQGTERE